MLQCKEPALQGMVLLCVQCVLTAITGQRSLFMANVVIVIACVCGQSKAMQKWETKQL